VVTAGFIDVHQHGQDLASQKLKAFDGGRQLSKWNWNPDVGKFLAAKKGRSILHYGTAASHRARAVWRLMRRSRWRNIAELWRGNQPASNGCATSQDFRSSA
jgi:hypothetical protein